MSGTVHDAVCAVIADLPAITKDARMTEGPAKYAYRSIEAIKTALKPLLATHGVHYSSVDMIVDDSEFAVRSGAMWQRCRMLVRWRVYASDGSYVEHVTRGEGTDSGDKASNKAMTAAEKYLLLQVFAIAEGGDDPDHHRPEEAVHRPADTWERWLKAGVLDAVGGDRDRAREFWAAHLPAPPAGGWTEDTGGEVIAAAAAWHANTATAAEPHPEPSPASEAATAQPDPTKPADGHTAAVAGPVDLDQLVERVNRMVVAQVRTELESLGLPTSGNGDTLRRRLVEALIAEAAS
jgi:hypothetical protein